MVIRTVHTSMEKMFFYNSKFLRIYQFRGALSKQSIFLKICLSVVCLPIVCRSAQQPKRVNQF